MRFFFSRSFSSRFSFPLISSGLASTPQKHTPASDSDSIKTSSVRTTTPALPRTIQEYTQRERECLRCLSCTCTCTYCGSVFFFFFHEESRKGAWLGLRQGNLTRHLNATRGEVHATEIRTCQTLCFIHTSVHTTPSRVSRRRTNHDQ